MAASSKENRSIHTPVITIILEAVIIAVTEEVPRVLTVQQGYTGTGRIAALPSGLLDAEKDATLEKALRAWVTLQTGLGVGYVEQLYTFGDRSRDPRAVSSPEQRHISVAYLALTRETEPARSYPAEWQNIYQFLPWEDWREGRPTIIDGKILPGLGAWLEGKVAASRQAAQRERVDLCFSRAGGHWDHERCLDRYELLFEAGLIAESPQTEAHTGGSAMLQDHRRILATALGRIRGKIRYRPVVFELLEREFTLLQLQRVVESLAGTPLHKQNFRRLVERTGLVEESGETDHQSPGRPAKFYRFRREVYRERPAPGVRFSAAGTWRR